MYPGISETSLGGETERMGGAAAPFAACALIGRKLADVERDLILATLAHCGGNRTRAAKILGISVRTLRNKLHAFGAAGPLPARREPV